MSESHQPQSLTGIEYEWRWKDETDNRRLPASWAAMGRKEPIECDEQAFYAIQYRFGLRLQYDVDSRTGEPTGLPNREEAACRILYVTVDGSRAVVEEWSAQLEQGGWKPTEKFASVVAKPIGAGGTVDKDHRAHYRDLLTERYDAA